MKKSIITMVLCGLIIASLSGCSLAVGGALGTEPALAMKPTLGQQLIDLQKAKDAGTITDAEFEAQKTKFLNSK